MQALFALLLVVLMFFTGEELSAIPFELFLVIIGVSIASGIGAFFRYLRYRRSKHEKLQKQIDAIKTEVEDLKKAIWRLNKTMIIMAKIQDSQVEKAHPDITSDLEDIASELLDTKAGQQS